jgi:superfamily II DNA or RNA helicase
LDYAPVFIANGFYKNITEFKREHVIYAQWSKFPKVDRYIGEGKLIRLRKSIEVEMPYERHTTRHVENIIVDYDKQLFDQVVKERWHPYQDRPIKDASELFGMMRKIANTNPSRVETVKKLLQTHPKLIVFYNFDYELELLRTLAEDITLAEWNGHKHESIPETDSWVYLVQYVAGAEGWNCTETDAMVFYSLTYSYKNFHQAMGRIDRLNTPFKDLYYYVLVSKSLIDIAVSRSLKAKKNFNEARYARAFS